MDVVEVARGIAADAHRDQVDKAGLPYLGHPSRVAARVAEAGGDEATVAAAWLHDVLEDSELTADDLRGAGVPEAVVAAVIALTRRSVVDADEYYAQVRADPIALAVKAADLADNTDPARLALLDAAMRERLLEKYAHAAAALGLATAPA